MHIETIGRGPALVCVHGWAMHSGVFAPMIERLQAHFECWLVDLPGHGRSSADPSLDRVAVADELLRRLPPAHWLGWSLGGLIAQEAALRDPIRVRGLIAIASSPRFVLGTDWPHAVSPAVFEQFGAELALDYAATIDRFLLLEVNGDADARRELRWLRERLAERPPCQQRALVDGLRVLAETDLRERLDGLAVPSLWIAGARDRLVPAAALEAAAMLAPGGQFRRIAGAGHAPFLSRADEVAAAVVGFAAFRRSDQAAPN